MKRRVFRQVEGEGRVAVAEVELSSDGSVRVEYLGAHGVQCHEDFERGGVTVRVGSAFVKLRVHDGRSFWDALPRAYLGGLRLEVEDVEG